MSDSCFLLGETGDGCRWSVHRDTVPAAAREGRFKLQLHNYSPHIPLSSSLKDISQLSYGAAALGILSMFLLTHLKKFEKEHGEDKPMIEGQDKRLRSIGFSV